MPSVDRSLTIWQIAGTSWKYAGQAVTTITDSVRLVFVIVTSALAMALFSLATPIILSVSAFIGIATGNKAEGAWQRVGHKSPQVS
ncbi:MAG: hypothetical protein AAFR03_06465 [Pseudomonadota bacterium]